MINLFKRSDDLYSLFCTNESLCNIELVRLKIGTGCYMVMKYKVT